MLDKLCPQALIYLVFSLVHVITALSEGQVKIAGVKFIVMVLFTSLIDTLCKNNLSSVAWFLVFMPFILMTLLTTLLLLAFGTSILTEKETIKEGNTNSQPVLNIENSVYDPTPYVGSQGEMINLAYQRENCKASQTTTYRNKTPQHGPCNAVDDNYKTMNHTGREDGKSQILTIPLKVDKKNPPVIDKIVVHTRSYFSGWNVARTTNMHVEVGFADKPDSFKVVTPANGFTFNTSYKHEIENVNTKGDTIKIVGVPGQWLHLRNVEAYAKK